MTGPKLVAIGGGHGAAATIQAGMLYASDVAAIVTVADDGGSSGRLARDLGVLPMGDIRNCLVALSSQPDLADLFQHRFAEGELAGHVVGNILIAAAYQRSGSFLDAIGQAGRLLGSRGLVVPPTLDRVRLVAEVQGERVEGQVSAANARGRIDRIYLEPSDAKACREAVELIASADQIVLGPGSLFTSVLPSLLVKEVGEAYLGSGAQKAYVCNLASPPGWSSGETAGFDACAHLEALHDHLGPRAVDFFIAHEGRTPPGPGRPVRVDRQGLEGSGVTVVSDDLMADDGTARHDPARLAKVLQALG